MQLILVFYKTALVKKKFFSLHLRTTALVVYNYIRYQSASCKTALVTYNFGISRWSQIKLYATCGGRLFI